MSSMYWKKTKQFAELLIRPAQGAQWAQWASIEHFQCRCAYNHCNNGILDHGIWWPLIWRFWCHMAIGAWIQLWTAKSGWFCKVILASDAMENGWRDLWKSVTCQHLSCQHFWMYFYDWNLISWVPSIHSWHSYIAIWFLSTSVSALHI